MVDEIKFTPSKKPKKPNKKNMAQDVIKYFTKRRDKSKAYKEAVKKYNLDQEKAKALQKIINNPANLNAPSSLGSKVKIGTGLAGAGGAGKVIYDVATKEFPDAPTYKKGGIVKKRANKSKTNSKSVAKKYFKGTF
tara:strand:- start:51 stop:458 length:408 start_codon:yes stop_codon:yes gene_type:complete